jgi:RES domain-containing protein
MKLARLAHTENILQAFNPGGGEARWNAQGIKIGYSSENAALAVLEVLNHWESYPSLSGYHLYHLTIDESHIEIPDLDLDRLRDKTYTRAFGGKWIKEVRSPILRVPSILVPEYNYLFNPAHSSFFANAKLEPYGPYQYDDRTLKLFDLARQRLERNQ